MDSIDVEAFREHLTGLGLSDRTTTTYLRNLRRAIRRAAERGIDLTAMQPSEAAQLAATWPNSNASRRQLAITLRHYWAMLGVTGPEKAVRVPPRPPVRWRGLEDDQVGRLLEGARGDWPRGAVVYLGLYLGLRREEIAGLRWGDFDDDLSWVRIQGKFDRVRHLPVHPELRDALQAARWPGEYVFPGRFGGHIALATVNGWVAELGHAAGIPNLYPHRLRHTSGAHINDTTGDIYAAMSWLGHQQVETTLVYTRLNRDRLVDAMATFDRWSPDPDLPDNVIPLRRAR